MTIFWTTTSTNHCDNYFMHISFNSQKHIRFIPIWQMNKGIREIKVEK